MTRIIDNITEDLLTTLRGTLQISRRADFCVGYLNLRGWPSREKTAKNATFRIAGQCPCNSR
ncbi:MAG: hypothetical protein JZU64_16750 [Rhodoferax sp.]|nr:hypothetical protein [Rhodoferax sp.]